MLLLVAATKSRLRRAKRGDLAYAPNGPGRDERRYQARGPGVPETEFRYVVTSDISETLSPLMAMAMPTPLDRLRCGVGRDVGQYFAADVPLSLDHLVRLRVFAVRVSDARAGREPARWQRSR